MPGAFAFKRFSQPALRGLVPTAEVAPAAAGRPISFPEERARCTGERPDAETHRPENLAAAALDAPASPSVKWGGAA
jgi:hypothetical protein